jgi:hypothetical protein
MRIFRDTFYAGWMFTLHPGPMFIPFPVAGKRCKSLQTVTDAHYSPQTPQSSHAHAQERLDALRDASNELMYMRTPVKLSQHAGTDTSAAGINLKKCGSTSHQKSPSSSRLYP